MKRIFLILFILTSLSYGAKSQNEILNVYVDSIVSDVSHHPIGINLNFFMDGGRFPHAKRSVTEAVKDMGMKYLRYPGGEKSDLYLFSMPPYEKSIPTLARTAGLEDYPGVIIDGKFTYDPLDFDEYMAVCKAANAEPVVVVAADNYLRKPKEGEFVTNREDLIKNAVEWVHYANIKKKYGIKFWMVGNESWNPNNVNSTADIYARDVIDFSKAMKAVDSSITIIANGEGDAFFKTVITKAGDYFDRLCVSNYGVWNFFAGYNTYRDTSQVLIYPALDGISAIKNYATPEQSKHMKLIVAEFGTIDWFKRWKWTNDVGHALVAFDMAGQLLSQPEIEFSCFWNTKWIENGKQIPAADYDALDSNGYLNPTGYALKVWGNFMGDKMIKTTSSLHTRSFASVNSSENKLFVYLLNVDGQSKNIQLNIQNRKIKSVVQAWELIGKNSDDLYPVWEKFHVNDQYNNIQLKGTSITVIEYQLE